MLQVTDPEFRLVAACCRPIRQAGRLDAIIAAALQPFDADRLLVLAHAHRVEALVEQGLAEAGFALPDAAASQLAQRVRNARLQMLRNAGEEVRLSQLLHSAGIDAIFVKGATLAMLAHGSLAHKVSWDIDLLVDHENINRAIAVLRAAGYEFDHPEIAKAGLAIEFAHRFRESCWTNAARGTTVELHWALTHNPRLLANVGMSSMRQEVVVGGAQAVATLATPDLFAFLAVHGTTHGWSRLKWLADVASLVEKTPEILPELLNKANLVNARRCAAVALVLMRDLLGVVVPDPLYAEVLRDPHVKKLTDQSMREMLVLASLDGKSDHRLSRWWALHTSQMAMAPGFRGAVADIWAKFNQPLVPRRLRLPRWLLVPDALLIWIPSALIRRIAITLQLFRSGNVASNP
jgi:hypothetical protein